MSCPDWDRLEELVRETGGLAAEEREGAIAHGLACPSCRERALRFDPLCVFRGSASWGSESTVAEVAQMQSSVAVLRRAGAHRRTPLRFATSTRFGTLAALWILAALWLVPLRPAVEPGRPPATATARAPAAGADPTPGQTRLELLDGGAARLYEWSEEEMHLVMVVDESLDV